MYWRNYGCKRLQTTPVIIKSYYVFVNPDGSDEASFKRFSYRLADNESYSTVIHYRGNHNVSQRYKVGKKQTCASVRKDLEEQNQSPSVVYKKKCMQICSTRISSSSLPKKSKTGVKFTIKAAATITTIT